MRLTFTIRNPFEFLNSPPPPPPPLYARVWKQISSSPRLALIGLCVGEKLAEYGVKKIIENSGRLNRGFEFLFSGFECAGIPAKEIMEVADVVFSGIHSGLRK